MSRDDRRLVLLVTAPVVALGALLGALMGVLTWLDESAEDDL